MITNIQKDSAPELLTTPPKSRAAVNYAEGSSFHDLFTSAVPISQEVALPAASPSVSPAPLPPPVFESGASVISADGSATPLNPMEMASASTAAQLAAKLGGTVTPEGFSGGYSTSSDIRDITFADSDVKINAGLAASLFATYGDAPGSEAWRVINNDLGRDPMATGTVS
jgi:hypothetical protein